MDLADQVDDYICSFEGLGDITMDSLAIFVFLFVVLVLVLLWLCNNLYQKYVKDKDQGNATSTTLSSSRQSSVAPGGATRLSEPREIQASKVEVKEVLSKPTSLTNTGRSSGRGPAPAPPQPGSTLRRRMVRQSSTGPENRRKRYVPPPSNVVGPETTSVTWTSQVFRWLYNDLVIVNELLMSWVIALNDTLRKLTAEQGIVIEAIRVLPDSPPPALNNLFCNADESNPADMLITFDCDAMPVLQVKTMRHKAGKLESSHYKVTVSRFRARLANAMNYNTLKGDMRVEGYPDIRIVMNSVGPVKPLDPEEQQFESVVTDILARALQDTVYPVDFSMYSTCPRGELEMQDLPVIYPVPYDTMANQMSPATTPTQMVSGRRLLVKIVAGDGLKEAANPYVVVEMDEPAQKNQTANQQGPQPQWNEHFLFDLSPQSAEILFEVYDAAAKETDPPKFLGLGLVGIEELAVGPAITQMLTLQPRPYETQTVYGSIVVDFVFIEGAEIPAAARPYKLREALHISTPAITEHLKNGANLADAAVRALQEGALSVNNGQPSKSTLIIHSVQRVEMNKDGQIEVKEDEMLKAIASEKDELDGAADSTDVVTPVAADNENLEKMIEAKSSVNVESDDISNEAPSLRTGNITSGNSDVLDTSLMVEQLGLPNATSSPNGPSPNNGYANGNRTATNTNATTTPTNAVAPADGVGMMGTSVLLDADERGRSKKRNFFGTLKKRLSRSKTRTHSADRGSPSRSQYNNYPTTTTTGTLNGDSRSLSVDRAVLSKSNSLGRRTAGMSPTLDHSRRSSLSESSAISGFSTASTKTYIHEASTLVLETIENGVKRHFIVPLNIAQRPRWRRKGTKLHIYNDHTFIAKHLSGSGLQCSICMKSIPRRPGKQGYECRDCQMICHKQCHIRAPQACPNPTVLSMELSKLNAAVADRSVRKS